MKPFKGYDKVKAYTESERLPAGGYVIKIMGAEEVAYDWGKVLLLSFDIVEGDYKGFYVKNYQAQTQEDKKWKGTYRMRVPKEDGSEQDEWTMRRFKTDMQSIEESNNYHWDWNEEGLKGKIVGALFRNEEYDFNNRQGFCTKCCALTGVEAIRQNTFKMPKDKLLKKSNENNASLDGFIPTDDIDDLPFN